MTAPVISAGDLVGLLGRVKAATGPDRELDAAIWEWTGVELSETVKVQGARTKVTTTVEGLCTKNLYEIAPAYTASIDAALALVDRVLPGWTWTLDRFGVLPSHAPGFRCILKRPDEWLSSADAKAPTAPLAILAALLSSLNQDGGKP